MLISGIQKTTLLDYPGKIATIIFTPGCNLRCKYCHNSNFVLPEKIALINPMIPEEIFFNYLNTVKGKIDGVVICGGEPTLQKDLYDFIKKIKEQGFLVKLDTNGRDPEILQRLINDNLVDYVAMDIKTSFEKWNNLVGITDTYEKYKESIKILINSNIDYEFRTTVVKNYHEIQDIENIGKMLSGAKQYNFQNYIGGNTLQVDFDGKSFTDSELQEFKIIALKYVKQSFIRN